MSVSPAAPQAKAPAQEVEVGGVSGLPDIVIYSHSPILYWWPIWAFGFVLAFMSYWDGGHMAYLPPGSEADGGGAVLEAPHDRMAANPYLGTWYFAVLLFVLVFSNVQLRGLWEWVTVLGIGLGLTLVSWLGWWTNVFAWFELVHVHINLAGYVFISSWVLAIWLLSVFFFDRRTYMIFSSGQVRIRDEIGEAEKVYDVTNMTFQVRPNVLIRHRVLGFYGAGDLVVHTAGPNPEVIEWPNVLFARSRLKEIQDRLKSREVV
ncbi:MAG: hypothetical protein U0793_30550 [Gemmataceae bacterium]